MRHAFRRARKIQAGCVVALALVGSVASQASGGPPALDAEPALRVLLARAERVAITLDAPAGLEVGAGALRLEAGLLTIESCEDGGRPAWRIAGGSQRVTGEGVLRSGGTPIFALDATPDFGAPRRLRFDGDLVLRASAGHVEVIERVSMETYLASVVGAEMNAKWPAQALAAQAIVARSYAAARWMDRFDEPWHLHWHYGVDMAYHGWTETRAKVAAAIASTRGEVLMFRGFPILALFHASSGGRTEAFERIKPGVLAPDGKTRIAAAMPVVDDAAAIPGAAALNLSATHGRWKTDIPLPEVTEALQRWSAADAKRTRFGVVEGVSVLARHEDSGRVATVSIRHVIDGERRFKTLPATDFRLAVSPVKIRSVLWDRCVIAAQKPGYLVLEGRGFGHGCGLSQVSAWYLARQGKTPEEIVARFYAGAVIERRY